MVRLQKYLSEAGVASRRAGEQMILDGRVSINGEAATKLGVKVDPQHDKVAVDGRRVTARKKLYVAVNKPPGYVCTRAADEDRQKIGDLIPREWRSLYTVGRLDTDSEGLIFLTNDGDFCLKLTHPRYRIPKVYLAQVEGRVEGTVLTAFTQGVMSAGEKLQARRVRLVSANQTTSVVELELTEGKNREVRRLFESRNLSVRRLQRVSIGPIRLGELPLGKWRTLTEPEIKSLLGLCML